MLAKATQLPVLGLAFAALRLMLLHLRSVFLFSWGAWRYNRTRRTPEVAYQAMIWLFCTSQGRFNDWVSRLLAKRNPKIDLVNRSGVLGEMDQPRSTSLVERLRYDGFIVFPQQLSSEMCDRLVAFAMTTPAIVRAMDNEDKPTAPRLALFDPVKPLAVRYDYAPADLLSQPDVQSLLADGSLLEVVQEYLGCQPVADVLSMWWHTNFHDHPDSEAAQYFHFDMDRLKWLKIFVYLTDVGPENGPHSFVRGSHRTGAIPWDILRRGYVRLSDEEVAFRYPKDDILSFTAPRGSIIIEDTRGLHKGVNVRGEPRLILQLQFSNSLFGANYSPAKLDAIFSTGLKSLLVRAPAIYRQYT